jgi:RF-1 domain
MDLCRPDRTMESGLGAERNRWLRSRRDRMEEAAHPACLDPDLLAAQCKLRLTRRSGPGGQNRNKVETAVVLVHGPTGVSAQASERRTQGENRREALWRLRLKLAVTVRRPVARVGAVPYAPSPLWRRRCRNGRIVVSSDHADFPALLAEALDLLEAAGLEPRAAATQLGCSPSSLIKLFKQAPNVLPMVNQRRREAGRHALD